MLQAMTVLAHMVEHLSDSDELNSCINIVLPSVVPMMGEQDVDIRTGSASTIRSSRSKRKCLTDVNSTV